MDATQFEKLGTVFWNHDYNRPVAKTIGKLRRGDRLIESDLQFAERPAEYQGEWFPDAVKALIEQGIVKGISVGLDPIEWRPATPNDRTRFGELVKRVISKWKLMEYSIAPIPSNSDALITAVHKGRVTATIFKAVTGTDPPPERSAADKAVAAAMEQLGDVKAEIKDAVSECIRHYMDKPDETLDQDQIIAMCMDKFGKADCPLCRKIYAIMLEPLTEPAPVKARFRPEVELPRMVREALYKRCGAVYAVD